MTGDLAIAPDALHPHGKNAPKAQQYPSASDHSQPVDRPRHKTS